MRELIIEYVFEGHKRGYNFTSPTQGFNDDTLKFVWRTAMPRGQGWGAAAYVDARSLKSFGLPDGRIALSETIVTGLRDESGRGGIRRSVIQVMQPGEYAEKLRVQLGLYPKAIQTEVTRKPRFGERRRVPKIRGHEQTIVSRLYSSPTDWQLVEGLILQTACNELDGGWFQGKYIPFTTLALEYRDESQLVALPEQRALELGVDRHSV